MTNGQMYVHIPAKAVNMVIALIGPYLSAVAPPPSRPKAEAPLAIATRSKANAGAMPIDTALRLINVRSEENSDHG